MTLRRAETEPDALARGPGRGDRMLALYLRWLPLLWLSGLYVLVMLGLVLRLAWRRWPADATINVIFCAWMLVAVTQGMSVVYNWSLAGLPLGALPGQLLSVTVIGWGFLGLGLAVGHSFGLDSATAVRGMMVLALHILILGLLGFAVAVAIGMPQLYIQTPLRALLGASHSADFYTLAMVFNTEQDVRRFILFFPWPTALSLAGICLVLVASCERDLRWRMIGYAGGLFAVVFSYSRAGYVVLPIAMSLPLLVRMGPALLAAGLASACVVALGLTVASLGPFQLADTLLGTFRDARAGSSAARDLIYSASWQGFLESPVFGWGWVGPSVIDEEELPIGSHSTFYGTLYTGGLVTFAALVLATGLTAAATVRRLIRRPDARAAAALAIFLALGAFAYGESLYSLVLPLMVVFLFLGGVLGSAEREVDA